MSTSQGKGAAHLGAMAIFLVLALVFLSSLGRDTDIKESARNSPLFPNATGERYWSGSESGFLSSGSGMVDISTGNARYEYQPSREYVTLRNSSDKSLNITGWKLKNAKDTRPYDRAGSLQYFPADFATIPQGTLFISPSGSNVMRDIVLAPGEEAVITTGRVAIGPPYSIVSFKENICSGYLDNMEQYEFTPRLENNCPRPEDEPGASSLDKSCKEFISRLYSCEIPKLGGKDIEGEYCPNCVGNERLSSSCAAFIKKHYSYEGCIAFHSSDPKFYDNTWRIFLNQGWEMWAEEDESISFFDRAGNLIKQESY